MKIRRISSSRRMFPAARTLWTLLWTVLVYSCHSAPSTKTMIVLSKVEVFGSSTMESSAVLGPYGPPPMTAVNLKVYLNRNLTDMKLNGVFALRSKSGNLDGTLYNRTIDACLFFKDPNKNRMLQIIQREIIQRSNMPTKCPIRAGHYYIWNASYANARIPSFFPPTLFRAEVNVLDGNMKHLLATHWYGKIMKVKTAPRGQ